MRPLLSFALALGCALLAWAPASADAQVVISEILQNPAAVPDADGEWFEVFNPTASLVDIEGWTIQDDDFDSHVISNGGPLVVPAGGYLVLGNNSALATNGGVLLDYEYSGIFLANGQDEIVLLDGALAEVDRVEWDDGVTFPDPNGASMALVAPGLDNNAGGSWCEATTPFGDGDLGTPRAANDCPAPTTADVVINEIDYDQASTDTAEFVELFNAGGAAADLTGYTLELVNGSGGGAIVYNTITLPSLSLPAGGYFVVCGNAAEVVNCDLDVSTDVNLIQNGAPDAIGLRDGSGTLVDALSYEGDSAAPYVEGSGAGLLDDPSTVFGGLSRAPNGADTDQNNADFAFRCISPGAATLGTSSGCIAPGTLPDIVINEVDADTPGSDAAEFVELFAVPNLPLDGLVVVFFNGSNDASYTAFDLDGFSTDAAGFFVLGNPGVPGVDLTFANGGLQNGADAVALYVGDAADFPNDTPVTTVGLVDAFVYDTNDSDDAALLVLLNPGEPQVNEGGGGDKDGHSSQRVPNGDGGPRNTSSYEQLTPTPGTENAPPPPPPAFVEIYEIQGSGLASPFDGLPVTTLGNVVTAVGPDGFFMQTPTSRTDGDAATSDGVYVFMGAAPAVAVGDLVDVSGTVDEFFDLTEIVSPTVTVVGAGLVPAAVTFDATTPSRDPTAPSCVVPGADIDEQNFECFEGMLVEVLAGVTGSGNQRFAPDPIAEVFAVAGADRAFREEGVAFPPPFALPPSIPIWDGNPEVFEVDPDRLGLPNLAIPGGSTFSARGALGFEFGGYELWPTTLAVAPAPLPAPVRAATPEEHTVASLNVFRLFDAVDDPPSTNAHGASRNDSVVPLAEYQTRLDKLSLYVRDVLGAPDVLAVQEAEKLGVLEDLAARITADGGPAYDAYLVEGNDVGTIDVGFLVQPARVAVTAVTQLGATETFIDPSDGSVDLLHDRPPLMLEATAVGGGAFAVLNVHQRSLGSIETSERVRRKRLAQAQSTAQMADDFQTANAGTGLAVVGDFNAFEFTDGFVHAVGRVQGAFDDARDLETGPDLVDPDLTNQVLSLPAEERYSFVFNGSAQTLDHALTTGVLGAKVTGFAFGRGNADAPQDLLGDPSTPLRASDHDGIVLFVDLTPPALTIAEDPIVLRPPYHRYQSVAVGDVVTGVSGGSVEDVFVVEVTSDEAENGRGDGNTTKDIVIIDCQTVDLRAERAGGGDGRVYTLTLAVEDAAGNRGAATVPVWVPPSENRPAVAGPAAYTVVSGCPAVAPVAAASEPADAQAAQTAAPDAYALHGNYPNPFVATTQIAFDTPEQAAVRVEVYDVTGRRIAVLQDGPLPAGMHRVTFDAAALPSGVYLYRIQAGSFSQTHRMVVTGR